MVEIELGMADGSDEIKVYDEVQDYEMRQHLQMRQHLLKCFQKKKMMPFPQSKKGDHNNYFPGREIELFCSLMQFLLFCSFSVLYFIPLCTK